MFESGAQFGYILLLITWLKIADLNLKELRLLGGLSPAFYLLCHNNNYCYITMVVGYVNTFCQLYNSILYIYLISIDRYLC